MEAEVEAGGHKPRHTRSPRSCKGPGGRSPRAPEGARPCRTLTLDFGL